MDYDFSGLCADQLERLEKRLDSLKKSCIKEYMIALNVINNPIANEKINEIKTAIDDAIALSIGNTHAVYTQCMNKVQRILKEHL